MDNGARKVPRSPQRTPFFNDPLNLVEQQYGPRTEMGQGREQEEGEDKEAGKAPPRTLTFV